MASVRGPVDILSFGFHRTVGSSESTQPCTPEILTELFRVEAAEANASGGRARKRRKLDQDATVDSQSAEAFDASQSVVLANVALELVSILRYAMCSFP